MTKYALLCCYINHYGTTEVKLGDIELTVSATKLGKSERINKQTLQVRNYCNVYGELIAYILPYFDQIAIV